MQFKKIAALTLMLFFSTGNIYTMAEEERDDARIAARNGSMIKSLLKGAISGAISGAMYALYSCTEQCAEQDDSVQCKWITEEKFCHLLPNPNPAFYPSREVCHSNINHHSATYSNWSEAQFAYLLSFPVALGLTAGAELLFCVHLYIHRKEMAAVDAIERRREWAAFDARRRHEQKRRT